MCPQLRPNFALHDLKLFPWRVNKKIKRKGSHPTCHPGAATPLGWCLLRFFPDRLCVSGEGARLCASPSKSGSCRCPPSQSLGGPCGGWQPAPPSGESWLTQSWAWGATFTTGPPVSLRRSCAMRATHPGTSGKAAAELETQRLALTSTVEQGSHARRAARGRASPGLAMDVAFTGRSWAREDTEQRASGGEPGWRTALGPSLSAARE